jgi:hypothetical protein
VISCPRCLRQYEISSDLHGKLGRCEECKSHFAITIVEPELPGEAFTLTNPITQRCNFMFDAATCLARNSVAMLELAGEPPTIDAVARFVKGLPHSPDDLQKTHWRDSYCSYVMRRANDKPSDVFDQNRCRVLMDYFLDHLLTRDSDILGLLVGAFAGVFSANFAPTPRQELAVLRKRGPLERFAERMGWEWHEDSLTYYGKRI